MIPREDIEKIMDATRIEEVVEAFVPLKKRGVNYIGSCPFHDEKTPSFNVNPSRGIFKCFGCGKGGDAVTFLMEHNHYTYPEALRWLAQKYGIPLHETQESEEEKQKKDEREELYNVNEFAQKYFRQNLLTTEEGQSVGLSYFREREIKQTTIDTWGLGYCMQKSDDFSLHALNAGYSEDVLIKSGLCIKSERNGNLFDRFHARVTFPIYNVAGRVLGFSARILTSDKTKAKYVNSPESLIYTKGKVLFGLYFAKNEIAKQDQCFLVEGNVDAVMMHQNGVKNVIATSGTALTEEQVHLIKRYTRNITILYDGDKAGIHATIRATDMFLKEGMHVKTVLFPDGDDPDSFARKHTQDEFKAFLETNAQNFILYRANLLLEETKNDPIKKASLVKEIVHSISLIPDMIERTTYIQQCSSLLNMDERVLNEELSRRIAHNIYEENKKQKNNTPAETDVATDNSEVRTGEQTQPRQSFDNDAQERAVIRILLQYSDKKTKQQIVNQDNKLTEETMNAGEYIVAMLASDNIRFENPLYQKIYSLFLREYSLFGKAPALDTLLHSEDGDLSDLVPSLLIDNYKTSPMWGKKYNVFVPETDSPISIDTDIKETLLHFKLHKIETLLKELHNQLKESSEEDSLSLLQKINTCNKQRNFIAKALNIITK
ncbi:MAG: DNA primase [Bacteroidales bacterium]|nr:DNA primase [Bacteroidales bacterium]